MNRSEGIGAGAAQREVVVGVGVAGVGVDACRLGGGVSSPDGISAGAVQRSESGWYGGVKMPEGICADSAQSECLLTVDLVGVVGCLSWL